MTLRCLFLANTQMMITTVSCFCVCFDVRMKRTVKKVKKKKNTHNITYIHLRTITI